MFFLVGLGLFDVKDISLKALECLKNVDMVYAEFFTSKLFGSSLESIEKLINKKIHILSREEVEEEQIFLKKSKLQDVALITGGDPLIATTHSEFIVQCSKKNIPYEVIHGSSILSSGPAISGLQGYKFGKVTTIPFVDYNYKPKSPYVAIEENLKMNLHTLVLLDIQEDKEKYMSVNEGLKYLLDIEKDLDYKGLIKKNSLAIGLARVGSKDVKVKAGKISDLINEDFGSFLHCIIIPSSLHIVEAEYLVEVADAPKEILDDI